MTRKLLVAGVLVALALIVLVVEVRGGGDAPPAPASAASSPATAAAAESSHTTATTAAPQLASDAPAVASDDGTREYTLNGAHVRDHRSGDPHPMTVPGDLHPPNTRRLPIPLVSAISDQVKQVMGACAQGLPADAFGTRPRMQGQLTVAIKDHQLSISKAEVQLQHVNDAAPQLASCIEQKSVGLSTPAADQPDLDAYTIRISYAVR